MLSLMAGMATGARGAAQAREHKTGGESERVVRTVEAASLFPFSLDAAHGGGGGIEFRAVRAITPEDRQAIDKAWAAMEKSAGECGFDLDRKGWTYEQIVSPAFSEHVLLLFSHDGAAGERSEFSAIVPRKAAEPLYVIPILRRGYFPYSAPQGNPMTMAAFNQAMKSERTHEKPYWLSVSICYAALSGAQVANNLAKANEGGDSTAVWGMAPELRAGSDGRAVARFAVAGAPGQYAAWEVTFDRNGNVVKAVASRINAPKLKVVRVVKPE
jgi:hypothetical protein